jgi:UDP-N-acetylmuramoyl-L-alanyl-D-glutamate--2,6-diaminopimelate ligase
MRLRNLISTLDSLQVLNFTDRNVTNITSDSRQVTPGAAFVALKGAAEDGHKYIDDAIARGASVIVVQDKVNVPGDICQVVAPNTRHVLAVMADIFYDHPSGKMKVIGVTGTNGKTTITYLLRSILEVSGSKVGLLGTINYEMAGRVIPASNTTPGALDVQRYLAEMAADGAQYAVMEVSSHALEQYRVDAVSFACAIFTNITPEHLDYHQTFDAYLTAKGKLFRYLPRGSVGVFNADDPNSISLAQRTKASQVWYGIDNPAAFSAELISMGLDGASIRLLTPVGQIEVQTQLIGIHNVYNILAAASATVSLGIGLNETAAGIQALAGVPGRLERIDEAKDFTAFVDYAHTDDGLKKVLAALRPLTDGKLIVVFGCGGNRDRTKRPRMGRVAQELADVIVVTSDNPRHEDPKAIIDEILTGTKPSDDLYVEPDRKKAIEAACRLAGADDVVVVAGKGHETYQLFADTVVPFDDRAVIREYIMRERS